MTAVKQSRRFPRLAIVVQARTGSTRLPGKILLPLGGRPLLERMIERVRAAETPFRLIVATTTDPADDPVVELSTKLGIEVFRGHPTDLLDRHYQAVRELGVEAVAKIPSDCPLIDPRVIDRVLGFFAERFGEFDYVSNLHPASYPDGNDVEVMTMEAMETAWREAKAPHEREHTTPFLWDNPERFRIGNVTSGDVDRSMTHRLTIDYPEDHQLISAVFDALHRPERPFFSVEDVVRLLDERPELYAINARYAGVNWYRNHLDDLRTVRKEETRRAPGPEGRG